MKFRIKNPFRIMKDWCTSIVERFKKYRAEKRFNKTTVVIPITWYEINMVIFHKGYMYRAEVSANNCLVTDFKNEPVMDLRLLSEIFRLVKKNLKSYDSMPLPKQR